MNQSTKQSTNHSMKGCAIRFGCVWFRFLIPLRNQRLPNSVPSNQTNNNHKTLGSVAHPAFRPPFVPTSFTNVRVISARLGQHHTRQNHKLKTKPKKNIFYRTIERTKLRTFVWFLPFECSLYCYRVTPVVVVGFGSTTMERNCGRFLEVESQGHNID